MRVFVTGANGFVGRPTVQELLSHNHTVLALARTDEQAQLYKEAGAEPHTGSLTDLESLKAGAKACDGVIHLAFVHDFSNLAKSCEIDRAAISAMGEAMANTGKPLVVANGTLGQPKGQVATEDQEPERDTPMADRSRSADLVYELAREKGVRGTVVRLSPVVHGKGDWGFIPMISGMSKEKGVVVYVGDGQSRWPAVHKKDTAALLRLAIEKGKAGATYHAVAEEGVKMKDLWTLVGKRVNLPVESKSAEEVMGNLGLFGALMAMDNPTSSEKTRKELGWEPKGLGLLEDVEANYFTS